MSCFCSSCQSFTEPTLPSTVVVDPSKNKVYVGQGGLLEIVRMSQKAADKKVLLMDQTRIFYLNENLEKAKHGLFWFVS